ncbi:hypothetical protein DICPUDRAFT_154647 [Dictyostelium purpureum]|uniref:Ferredoxin--NADP(+) reductase n=1 Tax=Dictyostelium purpureum TaxID=5786 RepID=F0ZRW1_DICPU|nr:uncharacterized protein DICPUDRAFT_154647 [Dictyostelium purpureum]EGC33299.1 hypothetical protein DICPUDRAFT_154647 [Dictyostelium purpureum]|eukprot:XP_003290155.1 hypothetical protein DICPUDRAFT_154647 [Dictyostelium purpureum]
MLKPSINFIKLGNKFNYCNKNIIYRSYCSSTSTTVNGSINNNNKDFHLCIIGSGPAGLYTAAKVHKQIPHANITILEKLPYPFGLVRSGISPDHQNEKKVKNTLEKVFLEHPNLIQFIGNVDIEKDIKFQYVKDSFHAVVLACGIEGDKKLGIPGESSLKNVYFAREFLGWLNGNLKDQHKEFDLSSENVAIVGQGNVALDVARLLLKKNSEELKKTDITSNSFDKINKSKVKNIHIIGRRGPLEVSFTNKEIREILTLPNVNTFINDKSILDSITEEQVSKLERAKKRTYDLFKQHLKEYNQETASNGNMNLIFHFLRSPAEMFGDVNNNEKIGSIKLEKNKLIMDGTKAVGLGEYETLECGSIFRSIGYTGTKQFPSVPFDFNTVSIPNKFGKVLEAPQSDTFIQGLYVSGWIKGGPSGSIPNISANSEETASTIHYDYENNLIPLSDTAKGYDSVVSYLQPNHKIINYENWKKIESEELKRGKEKVDLLYSKIEPLLNELTPLEGDMKEIIINWCNKIGYPVFCDNIYIINTSGPMDDVDIYCCGLDKKSLVICGNLLSSCTTDEVLAVLVQSLAHYKLKHNLKFIGITTIQRLISFYLLRTVLLSNQVYVDMGFNRFNIGDSPVASYNSIYVGTLIFSYFYSPLNFLFKLLSSAIKLRFENEADLYSLKCGFDMSKALKNIIRLEKVNPIYDYYFSLMIFNKHTYQNFFLRLNYIEKIKLKFK